MRCRGNGTIYNKDYIIMEILLFVVTRPLFHWLTRASNMTSFVSSSNYSYWELHYTL